MGLCLGTGQIRESPMLSPLADLEVLCKQELRDKAELSTAWRSVQGMRKHSYRAPLQRLGVILLLDVMSYLKKQGSMTHTPEQK